MPNRVSKTARSQARWVALFVVAAFLVLALAGCATVPPAPAVTPLDPSTPVEWAPDVAEAFAAEVPKAVQKVAKKEMEKQARLKGKALIDRALYDEIKKESGH